MMHTNPIFSGWHPSSRLFVHNVHPFTQDTTGGLDFLFGLFTEESGFDDDWLIWQFTFGQDFVDVVGGAVNHWGFGFASVLFSNVFANKRPQVIDVDGWAEVLVLFQVKVSHTDFTKVTWMVFVEVDSVMMLTSQ